MKSDMFSVTREDSYEGPVLSIKVKGLVHHANTESARNERFALEEVISVLVDYYKKAFPGTSVESIRCDSPSLIGGQLPSVRVEVRI